MVKSFLEHDKRHFNMTIRFSNDSDDAAVERFLFMVAYTDVIDWDVRTKLMTEWRRVIAKYRDLNMTVYESAGFYVDQMLSLGTVTVQVRFDDYILQVRRESSIIQTPAVLQGINEWVIPWVDSIYTELQDRNHCD
ncbi:hypothetical protein GCK32_019548 [Trichostrongylus colubriformis]|uniref:Uncharacterized protein n=1 Tax=Trichostrongylus colubriformis TaxID=6319 RepID=A0AAN8FLE7_TRICO